MVLMLHLGVHRDICADYDYSTKPFLYAVSGVAIPLFFIVSGYLLANKDITMKYILKKVWGIVRFCFIICLLWNLYNLCRTGTFNWDFPLCFVQKGRFGHFWYLGAMLIMYVVMPGVFSALKKNSVVWLSILGVICFSVFVSDYIYGVEKRFTIQTFRIWYWLLYFSIGACIRYNPIVINLVKWWHVLLFMVLYVSSVQVFNTKGIEFHFGDPMCFLYSVTLFCFCLKKKDFKYGSIVCVLSQCFLLIYALHEIILGMLVYHEPFVSIDEILPSWVDFFVEYIMSCLIISIIAVGIMKVPYSNKVFRI